MFLDTWGTKRLAITSHGHNQLVILHIEQLPHFSLLLPLHLPLFLGLACVPIRSQRNTLLRIINRLFDRNRPILEIHIVGPSLEEFDFCSSAAHGFEGSAKFQGADGGRGQEGREGEVGTGRYNEGLEFRGVERAGDCEACPSGS